MSACPSSPIAVLARCSTAVPDLASVAPVDPAAEDLLAALGAVTDPRKSGGVRHRLLTVLAAAVCAVLAGARSYTVIAEWAHGLPVSVRLRLGMGRRAPSESTFRRILQRVDADELASRTRTVWHYPHRLAVPARSGIAPADVSTSRAWWVPLRTTSRRPFSSC
jgi:DDE_Tnp_1-associated